MDDQNLPPDDVRDQPAQKPTLTPEEELDVLEAVWKIGEKKGLQLLRPDQLKKLTDAGRAGDIEDEVLDINQDLLEKISVEEIVNSIISTVTNFIREDYSESEWTTFTDRQKQLLINTRMYIGLGLSINMLRKRVENLINKVATYA